MLDIFVVIELSGSVTKFRKQRAKFTGRAHFLRRRGFVLVGGWWRLSLTTAAGLLDAVRLLFGFDGTRAAWKDEFVVLRGSESHEF